MCRNYVTVIHPNLSLFSSYLVTVISVYKLCSVRSYEQANLGYFFEDTQCIIYPMIVIFLVNNYERNNQLLKRAVEAIRYKLLICFPLLLFNLIFQRGILDTVNSKIRLSLKMINSKHGNRNGSTAVELCSYILQEGGGGWMNCTYRKMFVSSPKNCPACMIFINGSNDAPIVLRILN